MTLLRGNGETLPLQRWLAERVLPFEGLLSGEDAYWGALLGIAEMLASGTASFTDMPVPVRRPANKKPPNTPGQCKIRPPA